jgi:hypothetical protein
MNTVMERRVLTCRRELPGRTLIWNQRHRLHALREFERFTTPTGRIGELRTPGHCAHCLRRSPSQTATPAVTSADGPASAAFSTSISMPLTSTDDIFGKDRATS